MLQERIMNDLKAAMKGGNRRRQLVIQLLRSAIKNTEIAKQKNLDDASVLDVVAKEAKQRRESIVEFKKGNRQDLVDKEEAELAILLEYLPQQMSREEIIAAARQAIKEVSAQGPGDKGKVMQKIIAQLKGKADGREINNIVTGLLSGTIS